MGIRIGGELRGTGSLQDVCARHPVAGGMVTCARIASANADHTAHGLDQLCGVVADSALEDDLHVLNVGDVGRRISLDDNEICLFAGRNRAETGRGSQKLGPVRRRDVDRLDRREAAFDEELDAALVAKTGEDAADACRVGAGEEKAACAHEGQLERHFLCHESAPWEGLAVPGGAATGAHGQIADAGFGRHRVQHPALEWRAIGDGQLVDRQCGRDGDVVGHEVVNQAVDLGAWDGDIDPAREDRGGGGTDIGLLAGDVIRIGADGAMFQVINAEGGGFVVADRAQVGGDRGAAPVCLRDRGAELRARENACSP